MASRLSEESQVSLYRKSSIRPVVHEPTLADDLLQIEMVDLDGLLARPDFDQRIAQLPAHSLYVTIKQYGLGDLSTRSLLPALSEDQWTRILDYAAWKSDELDLRAGLEWLSAYHSIDPSLAAERLRCLEEEYQLALLSGRISLFNQEAYEQLSDTSSLQQILGEELWYRIDVDQAEQAIQLQNLIEALLEADPQYAINLFAHASYMPPNESALQLSQFRRARLEEDGFLSYQESAACFQPMAQKALVKLKRDLHAEAGVVAGEDSSKQGLQLSPSNQANTLWLDQVLAYADELDALKSEPEPSAESSRSDSPDFSVAEVQSSKQLPSMRLPLQEWIELLKMRLTLSSNALASYTGVEPEDSFGLKATMRTTRHLYSLGLEYLSGGNLDLAIHLVETQHPTTLTRAAIGLFQSLRDQACAELLNLWPQKAQKLQRLHRSGKSAQLMRTLDVDWLDPLGFEGIECLKGLFQLLPTVPQNPRDAFNEQRNDRMMLRPVRNLGDLVHFENRMSNFFNFLKSLHAQHPAGEEINTTDHEPLVHLDLQLDSWWIRLCTGAELSLERPSQASLAAFCDLQEDTIQSRLHSIAPCLELEELSLSDHATRELHNEWIQRLRARQPVLWAQRERGTYALSKALGC